MRRVSVRTVPTFSAWAFPMPMEPDPVTLIDHEDGRGWQTEDGMILDEQMNLMAEICYLNSTLNEESGERAKTVAGRLVHVETVVDGIAQSAGDYRDNSARMKQ